MEVIPLSPVLGAEIRDFELAMASPEYIHNLKSALDRHRLLLIRGCVFSDEDHVELLGRFGNVMSETGTFYFNREKDKITYVTTKPGKYIATASQFEFHADYQFTTQGAAHVFSLCALELNRSESTIFANMITAVDLLPARLRDRLRQLKVVQCLNSFTDDGSVIRQRFSKRDLTKDYDGYVAMHPAIGTHHRTGEPVLNISQQFSSHFLGVSDEESQEMFDEIDAAVYVDSNTFRHHWQLNDMVIWDNVALQHARDALDPNYTRTLRRVVCNPVNLAEMLQATREAGMDREIAPVPMTRACSRLSIP